MIITKVKQVIKEPIKLPEGMYKGIWLHDEITIEFEKETFIGKTDGSVPESIEVIVQISKKQDLAYILQN